MNAGEVTSDWAGSVGGRRPTNSRADSRSRAIDSPLGRALRFSVRRRLLPVVRDASNRLKYGSDGPRFAERVWVQPSEITRARAGRGGSFSALVADGDWDCATEPIESVAKFVACVEHWKHGVPWESTGVFEIMERLLLEKGSVDRCRNLDDVRRRYDELDAIFECVKAEGRMRTSVELGDVSSLSSFREPHGIIVHIDRHGMPIHGFGGSHRLAMAHVLELPVVPARVGIIHPSVLGTWRRRFSAGAPALA